MPTHQPVTDMFKPQTRRLTPTSTRAPGREQVTDTITIGSMKMRAVDMGGHEIARRMWETYSQASGRGRGRDGVSMWEAYPQVALTLALTLGLLAG